MRILVTGATGFIGRALVPHLVSAGHDVVAAVRDERAAPLLAGARVLGGFDLERDANWEPVISDVDAVVHLASLAHEVDHPSARERYWRVNVDGTRGLVDAAAKTGVTRFVHVSTAKVMGEQTPDIRTAWRESETPRPEGAYGESKLAGERVVERAASSPVIFRPPVVYGPGLKANLLRLMDGVSRGRLLPIGAIKNRRSLVYVGNLCDAIAVALEPSRVRTGTYFLSDGEDVSTPELARRMARALGTRARLAPVPPATLRLAGTLLGRGADVNRLVSSLAVDSGKFRNEARWKPRWTLDEGLRETAGWYRGRHSSNAK